MPQVTRLGDLCTGHACWPARPSIEGSPNVFTNNKETVRVGDLYIVHCCAGDCHVGHLLHGSPNVYANNKQVGRITDPIDCGSLVAQGSPNVVAN